MKNLRSLAGLMLLISMLFASRISAQRNSMPYGDGVDIIHTNQSLRFDIPAEKAFGRTVITAQIAEEKVASFTLSTKGNWQISKLKVDGRDAPLMQDSLSTTIFFPTAVSMGQTFKLEMEYTITQPRAGMYFINPKGTVPGQPQQIWAQGEPEDNSFWMPTHEMGAFDKMTGSITLTVPTKYKTVSNGNLVSSKKLKNGLRRDKWELDQPHASYLWTFAVGNYKVVKEAWNGIPVEYYVEPGYESYVASIFPKTKELLSFFSEKFGKYPWPSYRQIIVRGFTFGAMENTTAVNFNQNFQGTDRELENSIRNIAVVAHEMGHHWFGNIVTAGGWDQLTLNEGWATYCEYIALEHFLGKETADIWFRDYRDRYFGQCAHGDAHALINKTRAEKNIMSMFDNHSYRKGGWVLRQLEKHVGDSSFFASARFYLTTNYHGYATWEDLENSFETVCQQDLGWYFSQWGHTTGHSVIEANWAYMSGNVVFGFQQAQYPEWTLFTGNIPVVLIYPDGSKLEVDLTIDSVTAFKTYVVAVKQKPEMILIDPNRVVLADFIWNMSPKEYKKIVFAAEEYFPSRMDALDSLIAHREEIPNWNSLCRQMMQEDEYRIRAKAAEFANLTDSTIVEQLADFAKTDESYLVRKTALSRLEGPKWALLFKDLCRDSSIEVQALALSKLLTVDTSAAIGIATKIWGQSASQRPVIFERYLTTSLLDVLINVPSVKFDLCLASVCQNSGPYVWQELEGTDEKPGVMLRWLMKQNPAEQGKFLTYLAEFEGRFKFTTEFFGPKTVTMGTGK